MTIGATEFDFVADMVRRETAIVLASGKEYLVQARLLPLAVAAGERDVERWLRRVRRAGSPAERRAIVEALTTNETSWFRDAPVYDALRHEVLPELVAGRSHEPLRLWSAASSSGQEAYSLAMLCHELDPYGAADILGTDVAGSIVEKARTGWYDDLAMGRGLTAAQRAAHFTRAGAGWQVTPALRRTVRFEQLNLAGRFPPLPPMDLVLLRNVLIYFDAATQRDVLLRVRDVMAPGGWLVLGTAETAGGLGSVLEAVRLGGVTVYRAV